MSISTKPKRSVFCSQLNYIISTLYNAEYLILPVVQHRDSNGFIVIQYLSSELIYLRRSHPRPLWMMFRRVIEPPFTHHAGQITQAY